MPIDLEIDDAFAKELARIDYTAALRLGLYDFRGFYMDQRRGLFSTKPLPTFITKDYQVAGGRLRAGFDILFKKIISAIAATSVKIALTRIYKIMQEVYRASIEYAPYETGRLRSSAKLRVNSDIVGECAADGEGNIILNFSDISKLIARASQTKLKKTQFSITFRRVKGEIAEDYTAKGRRPEQFDIAMFLHEREDWSPRKGRYPVGPKWLERAFMHYTPDFRKALDTLLKEVRKDNNIIFRRFDQRK